MKLHDWIFHLHEYAGQTVNDFNCPACLVCFEDHAAQGCAAWSQEAVLSEKQS